MIQLFSNLFKDSGVIDISYMADSIDYIIRKYCLINATEHQGIAQPKSVLGKILGDQPDMRSQVLMLRSQVERAAEEINRMTPQQQKKELDKMGGYVPVRREEKKGLPELDRKDRFVVRFAPNPDGALHAGNARPAVLCDEYARKYGGKFILRFDDTDPKIKIPEKQFYKWIREDLKWLGIRVNQEIIASKRLKIYYKHAEDLIKKEAAYVCTCGERWKTSRNKSQACECRRQDLKANIKKWKKMMSHSYKERQAVLRIKTDMDAKNPAVRDWPAFRIVDKPRHPLQKGHLWPLYNFASAIDDYLTGVTHIFRGQEHSTNEVKQRYLYQHMGWTYPTVITLGRFSMRLCPNATKTSLTEHTTLIFPMKSTITVGIALTSLLTERGYAAYSARFHPSCLPWTTCICPRPSRSSADFAKDWCS